MLNIKKILLCMLVLCPLHAQAGEAAVPAQAGYGLRAAIQSSWTLPVRPVALAQSLDGKKAFILGEDAKVHVYAPAGEKLGEIPVDPGTSGLAIAPRGEALYLINGQTKSYTALDLNYKTQIDISGAPVRGKADAPVTLVLFSDFECPWCGRLEPTLAQLLENNADKLRIVFKHLPLNNLHPYAESAALAAIAAQKQGKFWEMHDALFRTSQWTPASVGEAAKVAGLDMARFNADVGSQETRERLAKDRMDAQQSEISATPSLFINGWQVRDRSLSALQAMVNTVLAEPGK